MLRLSRHDSDTGRAVLILEGRFVDAWADVLERECAEAERSGLAVALDLSEVRYISRAALAAVARLCRRGVAIAACPPLIAEMLEQEGIDALACSLRGMEKQVQLSTGVRMEYVEQGSAEGLPLILLHGVTDSWHSFERVLPLLPPGIHAFAVSQRGHGDSGRPEGGYLLSDMSRDVGAFMDAVGLERAVVAGHSMGSMVAQRFVVDHPHRVSALVLMGAFPTLYQDPGLTDYYRTAIAPLTDPIDPGFAREWQLSTLARPIPEDYLATVVAETLKVPARVWRAAFKGFLETPDFSDGLARVNVPTLLQWGDLDTYTSRAGQDRLLSLIPGAKLVVYEGNGHAIHWEDPVRVTGDFVSFLLAQASLAPRLR